MHTTAKKHIKEKGKKEKSLFVLLLNVLREEGEREGKGREKSLTLIPHLYQCCTLTIYKNTLHTQLNSTSYISQKHENYTLPRTPTRIA